MNYHGTKLGYLKASLFAYILLVADSVWAQPFLEGTLIAEDRNFFFHLITGGYGAFIITFFGLGGLGSLFLTRSGNSSKSTPMLGVVMLLLAGMTFAYRVMIRAGVMGHEYIQW